MIEPGDADYEATFAALILGRAQEALTDAQELREHGFRPETVRGLPSMVWRRPDGSLFTTDYALAVVRAIRPDTKEGLERTGTARRGRRAPPSGRGRAAAEVRGAAGGVAAQPPRWVGRTPGASPQEAGKGLIRRVPQVPPEASAAVEGDEGRGRGPRPAR